MSFEQRIPHPFTEEGIKRYAPGIAGVYGISNAREWIYIGQGDNIRIGLLDHLRDLGTAVLKWQPTGFVFEACEGGWRQTRLDCLVMEYSPVCIQGAVQRRQSALSKRQTSNSPPPNRFILKGFSQDQTYRRFAFEGIAEDGVRTAVAVRADLSLVRVHGIHFQELPLLCQKLLERRTASMSADPLVLTEADMLQHQADRAAASTQKKKNHPRPPPEHASKAWRRAVPLSLQNQR